MTLNKNNKDEQYHITPAFAKLPVMCRLFWHKEAEMTDSGSPYCKRCGSHSYYDDINLGGVSNSWYDGGMLVKPIWWIKRKWYQFKCDLKQWFNHTFRGDELPF